MTYVTGVGIRCHLQARSRITSLIESVFADSRHTQHINELKAKTINED
jgi:hypothetical protein